jgi:dolichol-phosphate mannosyltransferase
LNDLANQEPAFDTSSWHLFGGKGLMYEYWFPIEEQNNRNILLVSKNVANLNSDEVISRVQQAGDIKDITLWKNSRSVGLYYYRLVKGYQGKSSKENTTFVIPQ